MGVLVGSEEVAVEHLVVCMHLLVAMVHTMVAQHGLAARAGGDGWVGAGGSSARWWRHLEERHDTHGVARGTWR